jgi:transposase
VLTRAATDAGTTKRFRRSWSRDQKRRIVEETFHPEASVADVARRHGVNADLLFKVEFPGQLSLEINTRLHRQT